MSAWANHCGRVYRRVARVFPHDFRVVCGDGLEQLGADVIPIVWRERGLIGLARLFADLAVQLPLQHLAAWTHSLKELTMAGDLFEGTWKSKNDESQFDPKYKPEQACLRFEPTEHGYLMIAYGIKDGQPVAERPQLLIPDGRRRPIVDVNGRPIPGVPAGAVAFCDRPDPHTIVGGAEIDGKVLGKGIYRVSDDGNTMTVTTEGMGVKGPFKVQAVFERV